MDFLVVDFYIPSKNLAIELQGPPHYIKPENKDMNLLTEFKLKCLEKMGYNIISIPFNIVSTEDSSLDAYVLQRIEEIS